MNAPSPSPLPEIRGWCPGALRPMMSGDGLVVRVRPPCGCLTREQALGIAALSKKHGNGVLDLSSRANLQIRGVTKEAHAPLLKGLDALGLLDKDAAQEARRNILHHPFAADDGFGAELEAALKAVVLPALSSKFGYTLDIGPQPVLQDAPADIRLERALDGGLILRADGAPVGKRVTVADAISEMLALTRWFAENGGLAAGRMRRLLSAGVKLPPGHGVPRPIAGPRATPGPQEHGYLVALAFGHMKAATLGALAELGDLRLTPWRMLLIEGLNEPPVPTDVITRADDPLLRVVACVGQPACLQARGETRDHARQLAPLVRPGKILHMSGCSKGCAHRKDANVTLIPGPGGFDLIREGRADGSPNCTALSMADVEAALMGETDAT